MIATAERSRIKAAQLKAVDLWQHQVKQDDIGRLGLQQPQRAQPVDGNDRVEAPDRQVCPDQVHDVPKWPIRTRWSAPTPTPPWSTASPCSAGASAASRRKAAMLGQPYSMVLPEVIGVKLSASSRKASPRPISCSPSRRCCASAAWSANSSSSSAPGLSGLTIADRAHARQHVAGIRRHLRVFPVDDDTIDYLRNTARPEARVALVAAYAKAQGMYRTKNTPGPRVSPTCSSSNCHRSSRRSPDPSARKDRVALKDRSRPGSAVAMDKEFGKAASAGKRVPVERPQARSRPWRRGDRGDHVMHQHLEPDGDGRRRAARPQRRRRGLTVKPWVKTSLAPGSQVVGEYLAKSGLQKDLDKLGFNLVGYGCTTCIGNSGPLPPEISKTINDNDLVAAAVLSGNRNFEGRVNQDVRAQLSASPPLVGRLCHRPAR